MMNTNYSPGKADAAQIEDSRGDNWTLILVKNLNHSPQKVWNAITDPEQLREWAPFDADGSLAVQGSTVKLTTVGAPGPHVVETTIGRAEPPRRLEFNWGGGNTRWELEPSGEGTQLTLWAQIDKRFIAMGAAGWHICLDVLDRFLDGNPVGRIAGPETMKFEGWQRLNKEYGEQFGIEAPSW